MSKQGDGWGRYRSLLIAAGVVAVFDVVGLAYDFIAAEQPSPYIPVPPSTVATSRTTSTTTVTVTVLRP